MLILKRKIKEIQRVKVNIHLIWHNYFEEKWVREKISDLLKQQMSSVFTWFLTSCLHYQIAFRIHAFYLKPQEAPCVKRSPEFIT